MNQELDRLLSKTDQPSITEREAVFEAVYDELQAKGELAARLAKPLSWTRWLRPATAALALALGLFSLLVLSTRERNFGTRGGETAAVGLTLACDGPCTRGSV